MDQRVPTIATLNIPEISLGIVVNSMDFVRLSISPIVINHGINEMKLELGIQFVQMNDNTGQSLKDLLNGDHWTINGPIILKGATFAEKVSSDLEFLISKSSESYSIPRLPDADEILDKSDVSFHVDGSEINIDILLVLPRLLPLPQKIKIPAFLNFGIFGTSEKAIDITLNPIDVETKEAIKVTTGLKMVPVNSIEASYSLAGALNPILSLNPSNSSVRVGNIMFSVDGHILKWSETLLKSETITIPLKAICISCFVFDKPSVTSAKNLPQPNGVSISQLVDASGFAISASIDTLELNKLRLALKLGYFGLSVHLQRKDFITFDLPSGIHLSKNQSQMNLKSRLILAHEPSLATHLQDTLNAVWYGDQSSNIGITGIFLGESEQNLIQTFSKILVEFDANTFYSRELPQLAGTSDGSNSIGALTSAVLELRSANQLQITAGVSLYDVPISISVGSIFLRAKLDDDELVSVAFSPLSASPEHKSLCVDATLLLASGNPKLSDKVAAISNMLLDSESIGDLKLSVTGLFISPPGISSGPGVIDQFKDLQIPIKLHKSNDQYSRASLIDTYAIKDNIKLSSLGVNIEGVDFKTMPKSVLVLSANVAYNNQLPIKLVLPYFKAEVALQDVALVEQTITGINLSDGSGQMSPRAHWYFQQQDITIQHHIAELVAEIDKKNGIKTKVSVRGFYFGVSDTDRNDLFSRINVDISKLVENIRLPTLDISDVGKKMNLSDNGRYELLKANFQVLPNKKMALDASIAVKDFAAVTINVGTLQSGFSINNSPLMKVIIRGIDGNFGSEALNLDIGADLFFQENERTPIEVASIAYAATHNTSVGSAFKLNQFSLGFSENDKIDTFSKVILPLPADALIQRIKGENVGDDTTPNSFDLGLQAKKLEVSFKPDSTITSFATASAKLPYNLSFFLPYLDARMAVDGTYAARSVIEKVSISSSEISGGIMVIFQDSEELENKLESLSETLSNKEKTDKKAGLHGIIFGVSEEDSIKAFSILQLELAVDSLFSQSDSQKSSLMNAMADAYIDAMKIKNIDIATESGQSMKSSIEVEFNNNLNVTINGLGHFAGLLAIDGEPIVETMLSGLRLNPGSNNVLFNANVHFCSSQNSQIQVATLINDVLCKDQSDLTQTIWGTGLEIGHSSIDFIKALRKVKIGVKASQLLKKPTSDDIGFKPEKLLRNLKVRKNDIDISETDAIKIGLDVSLSNVTLPVTANIGYMGLSTKLEGADLATVGVHDFIISHDSTNIGISFDIKVNIPGGKDIKTKVAETAKNIMDHGIHNASVSVELYNIGVGSSLNDVIDTFAIISADLNPLYYLPADSFLPAFSYSNSTVKVDKIYVDVLDSRRLSAEVHGRLINFPPISLKVPYVAISSHIDGEELLEVSISDILLKEGALSLNSILYAHKNLNAAQKLAYIVGDILFHRPRLPLLNKMNMLSLRFGSSEESAIDIFEYLSLDAPMDNMLEPIYKVQETPDKWIEMIEMKSKISATGLDASVVGRPFPDILPFAAKNKEAGATAKIGYGVNGSQTIVNIFFQDLFFTPGKPFTGKADIQVLVPEILPYLKQNLPNLFEWKNYDQNISVGWPVMTIGDPHSPSVSFDPFDQIFMDAPPLFLWTPLTFVPKLVNPFKNGLGLDVDIHVPNPGPLFADFGFLTIRMYHKGKEVAIVTNPRPVIIKNKMNGGELFGTNTITLQVRIHLSRNPFKAWEELSDMIHNFQDYDVDIESSTPELGRVEWLSTCFQHFPEYMTGQVVPMLISMLAHIKLKVGPWTITPPERFRRGAQMLNKLDSEHIKLVSSEVEVDTAHFMAQGHVSAFSGVTNAEQFEEWLQRAHLNSEWGDNNLRIDGSQDSFVQVH